MHILAAGCGVLAVLTATDVPEILAVNKTDDYSRSRNDSERPGNGLKNGTIFRSSNRFGSYSRRIGVGSGNLSTSPAALELDK